MQAAPAPRQRNASRTKSHIVETAKAIFSRLGYSSTSIREVAAAASVDPVLVRRYFGSKAGLFEATLIDGLVVNSSNPPEEKPGFGHRLAQRMLNDRAQSDFALVTLTTEDLEARRIGDRIVKQHILPQIAEWLGPPDADIRARNFFILTNGFALHIQQTRVTDSPPDIEAGTIRWFAQAVQDIVDQT